MSKSKSGKFVIDIYCFYGAVCETSGFAFTIRPIEQLSTEYACINGSFGVGTCDPQKKMHIKGEMRLANESSSNYYLDIQSTNTYIKMNSNSVPFLFNNTIYSSDGFYAPYNTNLKLGISNNAQLTINNNGLVGIGTDNPNYKLDVAGSINSSDTIKAMAIKTSTITVIDSISTKNIKSSGTISATNIETKSLKVSILNGADYVFDENYELLPLDTILSFIHQNHRLPDIQSAEDMKNNGICVDEFQIQLLKKIEERTLYIIQQEERIQQLEKSNK